MTTSPSCPLRAALLSAGLLGCACAASGCTEYKPASDTYVESAPLEGANDWSCLGGPVEATPPAGSPGADVTYRLRLVDLGTANGVPDISARVCALTDINCLSPVAEGLVSDDQGWVDLPVTENFRGYVELQGEGVVRYLFHLPDTQLRTMADYPLAMIRDESFGALLAAFGLQPNPTLGGIAVRAFDCVGEEAAGVVLETDAGGVEWYFRGGLPDIDQTATDGDGLGGFIGSTPGVTELVAALVNGVPTTSKSVIVRAGWVTAGYMRPRRALR